MDPATETIPLRDGAATVITVMGELDLASSEDLKELGEDGKLTPGPVVVDLSSCSFMDSVSLGRIVMLSRLVDDSGRPVRLAVVAPHGSQVGRLLRVSGADRLLQIFETRAGAICSLDGLPGEQLS